jgi:hypothetical protein
MDFCEKTTNSIRTFVNKVCDMKLSNKSFSGGLPVSISSSLLPRIAGIHPETYLEYTLSYKADGQRQYLGFICIDGEFISFLQNRDGTFQNIVLELYDIAYEGTLFDVERLDDDTLLIFDCASIHGNVCRDEFYPNRLELARACLQTIHEMCGYKSQVVRKTTKYEYKSNYKDIIVTTPCWKMKVKALFYSGEIQMLPLEWIYKDDGFIWTLATSSFHTYHGHKLSVLKWKPPHRITIDFMVTKLATSLHFDKNICTDQINTGYRTTRGSHRLCTQNNGNNIWFSCIDTIVKNGIYECSWNEAQKIWHIELPRPDKKYANSLSTIVNTIHNIREAITRDQLL